MSSLAFGGGLAGVARVAFEAETGQFNADTARAEQVYRDATSGMSDDAIRLELAQRRLHRELAKGPNNYERIAKAELEVRRSERALRTENERLERSFRDTGRSLDRAGKGATVGSGAFRGLARSVAFASASLLGGAGLVYGIRQAIDVASNLEEQQNKVRVTFRESGQEVLDWSRTSSTSLGIARDQALSYAATLGGILNVSGLARSESARLSQDLVRLAADMASFNNASPEETLEALRAGLVGETEPLRRFQVLLSQARVEEEAYAAGIARRGEKLTEAQKVQARYALILKDTTDQQGDFARTQDGLANSQRTLSALWRDAQGLLGQALAPAYTDVVKSLRDWLSEEENQEELQRRINELVGTAEKVVRGFASGLELATDVAKPLVEALGGVENAVKALTLLWVAHKLKALAGFAGTAAASRATSARMIADATAAGRAWDLATRPRNLVITTTAAGGGVPGAGGKVGKGGLGGLLGSLPLLLLGGFALGSSGSSSEGRVVKRGDRYYFVHDEFGIDEEISERMARARAPELFTTPETPKPTGPGGLPVLTPQEPGRPARPPKPPRRTSLDLEVDLARALTTPGTSDEKRLYREQVARYEAQIRQLERRRRLTDQQKQTLRRLYGDLAAAQSAIDSIEDAEEERLREQREARARRRREARERAARAEERRERARRHRDRVERARLERAYREDLARGGWSIRNPNLVRDNRRGRRSASRDSDERDEVRYTLEQVREMQMRFLVDFRSTLDQFGSNLLPPSMGQVGTHSVIQTELLREQNYLIKQLTSTARHPGARYAKTELAAGFGAVGF